MWVVPARKRGLGKIAVVVAALLLVSHPSSELPSLESVGRKVIHSSESHL